MKSGKAKRLRRQARKERQRAKWVKAIGDALAFTEDDGLQKSSPFLDMLTVRGMDREELGRRV